MLQDTGLRKENGCRHNTVPSKALRKRVVYLALPFYNGVDDLKKKITDLALSSFPEFYFRLVCKAHDTLGRHFNH
jgi:hypothetical protein